MRDYFYNGRVRLDWGFGNPNVTGSLIALLVLAVWLLAHLPRGWGTAGFIFALFTNTILGIALVQTYSRGAAVSLLVGAVPLAAYAPRPWARWKGIALVLTVLALASYAFHLGFSNRTLHGMTGEDRSVTNRWLIYKHIPRMTWDAPEGWGHERGAEAFRQWYQPVGRTETYGRLVNSHATWLVEWPWYSRTGYGLAWALVLTLCLPTGGYRLATPLAVWIAFGLGACFTTIAHHWQLWILPGAVLLVMLLTRIIQKSWPKKREWKGALAVCIVLGICWWTWALTTSSQVILNHGVVTVQGVDPKYTVLFPGLDETVMGKFYGHRIRERCSNEPLRIIFRWHPESPTLPVAEVCVLAGKIAEQIRPADMESLSKTKRFLLLNPDPPSKPLLKLLEASTCPPTSVQLGSFAGGAGRYFWQTLAAKQPHTFKLEEIQGSGRFLPSWSRTNF